MLRFVVAFNSCLASIPAAGFDVWMGNTRGNTYSRRNVNGLYTYMAEFWYFSFDQLATIDLPTMIDFALAKAGASKLAFVGHSQVWGYTILYTIQCDDRRCDAATMTRPIGGCRAGLHAASTDTHKV